MKFASIPGKLLCMAALGLREISFFPSVMGHSLSCDLARCKIYTEQKGIHILNDPSSHISNILLASPIVAS